MTTNLPQSRPNQAADASLSSEPLSAEARTLLQSISPEALAQALSEKLAITPNDWHRLNSNRNVRAQEQTAAALVYLLKGHPEEALPRLSQAVGWLDRSLKAPPCPTHGKTTHGKKS
ncbi:MAG: DUF6439 family protein [Cyanobacteria bacterium J06649_4]